MNETVITLFGAIDRYWYNKNYLKYFLDKAKGQPVRLKVSSYGGGGGGGGGGGRFPVMAVMWPKRSPCPP